jgi:transcriptional regulator with XRE-family HTH domain
MRTSREIAGLSQDVTAGILGLDVDIYRKMENGIDVPDISLDLLIAAGNVFDVPFDFLIGTTDDWECGIERRNNDVISMMMLEWQRQRMTTVNQIRIQENKIKIIGRTIGIFQEAITECRVAIDKFAKLNPLFQDMKAGAAVVGSIQRAEMAVNNAQGDLKRYKVDIECSQKDVFD